MAEPLSAYVHRTALVDASGVQTEGVNKVSMYSWDTPSLSWVRFSGASGGGGAVSVVDGGDVAQGSTTDPAVYGDVPGTVEARLRGIGILLRGRGSAMPPATAAVTSSDSTVVAANATRTKLVVINLGSVNVHFGDGTAAAMNSGITLTPSGTWVMDNYTFSVAAIHAVCASSSTLAIQEYQ